MSTYTNGPPITFPNHPDNTLLRATPTTLDPIYLVENGLRRRFIDPAVLVENGFDLRFVVSTSRVYPDGPPITSHEPSLADPACHR